MPLAKSEGFLINQMVRLIHTSPMIEEMKENIANQPKDCIMVCRDGVAEAHRVALCWASPYFMRVITQNKAGRVFLPQFDVEDIRLLVELIYGREITVQDSRMESLVDCARQLEISFQL